MVENSPAFQRWEPCSYGLSPEGTVEVQTGQPSLRDLSSTAPPPSVETLGYCWTSLRDGHGEVARIAVALDSKSGLPSDRRQATAAEFGTNSLLPPVKSDSVRLGGFVLATT